jgi:hypothetical protein
MRGRTSAATTAASSTLTTRKAPYAFTGTVKHVVFDLKPAAHEDQQALHEPASPNAVAHGVGA